MYKICLPAILALLLSASAYAQYSSPLDLPPKSSDMPAWAQYLYSNRINVRTLDSAYQAYYAQNIYQKNNYTKYYRRWRRKVEPFVGSDGYVASYTAPQIEQMYGRASKASSGRAAQSAAQTWRQMTMETFWPGTGTACPWQANIYGIDICRAFPNVMVCCTEPGAIFKSADKGLTWNQIGADYHLSTEAVSIHPTNPDIIAIGTNGAIRISNDGGTQWNTVYTQSDLYCYDIEIHPSNPGIILAATNYGLLRTADGGGTWGYVTTGSVCELEINPGNQDVIYILKENAATKLYEFWKSTDAGQTFSVRSTGWVTGLTDGSGRMTVTPADPNRVYAVLLTSGGPRVMKSVNAGETWVVAASGSTTALAMTNGQGYYDLSIMASQSNPDHLIVATTTAYKSTDGGLTYQTLGGYSGPFSIHPDIQEMKAIGNDTWIATDGGLTYSTDFFTDTKNAQTRMKGINATDLWGFDGGWNLDILVGGRYHNGNTIYYEKHGGKFLRMGGGEAATGYVNPINARKCFFSDIGCYAVKDTDDGNFASFQVALWPNESYYLTEYSTMVWDPRCYSTVWMGNGKTLYRSINDAVSYQPVFVSPDTGAAIEHIQIARSNPLVMYVTQRSNVLYDGKIWKTTDGGLTWNVLTPPAGMNGGQRRLMQIALSATNENELWVAFRSGGSANRVYKTADGGQSWVNWTTPTIKDQTISDIVHQMGTNGGVYIACDGGQVFYRNNSMSDWQPYGQGLPLDLWTRALKLFYRDSRLRIGSGQGIWDAPLFEQSRTIAQPCVDKTLSECPRDTFYFDDYSVVDHNGATWQWQFPGAQYVSSATARNPRVVFGTPGTYSVTLKVSGPGGTDTRTITDMVQVKASQCGIDTVPGLALNLSTPQDFATLSPVPALRGAKGFTCSAWIMLDTIQQSFSQILTNWTSDVGFGFGFSFQGYRSNTNLTFYWKGVPYQLTSPYNLDTARWIHVAMTVAPDKVTLYRDGQPWEYKGNFANFDLSATPFEVGIGVPGQGGNFRGKIEELKMYNRTLSTDEVRRSMHLIPKNRDTSLVAYYQFNEASQAVFYDRAGVAHGANGNGTRVVSTAPVATGQSYTLNVSSGGQKNFTGTGLQLFFQQPGTYPDGDMVAFRLYGKPDTLPNQTDRFGNTYWILRNYGKAGALMLDSAVFGKLGMTGLSALDAANPNRLRLYWRQANEHLNTWGVPIATGYRADSAASLVVYAGNNGMDQGQYVIGTTGNSTLDVREEEEDEDDRRAMQVLHVRPQPVRDMCIVEYSSGHPGQGSVKLELYNALGELVQSWSASASNQYQLNMSVLPSGVYILRVNNSRVRIVH